MKNELEEYKKCREYKKKFFENLEKKGLRILCTKCFEWGHHKYKCNNKPVCYICRSPDHTRYQCKYRLCEKCGYYGHYKKQCEKAWKIKKSKN